MGLYIHLQYIHGGGGGGAGVGMGLFVKRFGGLIYSHIWEGLIGGGGGIIAFLQYNVI